MLCLFLQEWKQLLPFPSADTATSEEVLMKFFSSLSLFLLASDEFRVHRAISHLPSDPWCGGQTNNLKWKISDPGEWSKIHKLGQAGPATQKDQARSVPSERTCWVGAALTVSCFPDFWPVVWPGDTVQLMAGRRQGSWHNILGRNWSQSSKTGFADSSALLGPTGKCIMDVGLARSRGCCCRKQLNEGREKHWVPQRNETGGVVWKHSSKLSWARCPLKCLLHFGEAKSHFPSPAEKLQITHRWLWTCFTSYAGLQLYQFII